MDRGIERRVMGTAIFASFVVISAVLMATYPINHVRAYPYGSNIGEYDFGTIVYRMMKTVIRGGSFSGIGRAI